MVFTPPSWVKPLPFDVPEDVSIPDFIFGDNHGRYPLKNAQKPFTCGLSGKTYTAVQVKERIDLLARGLAKELGFKVNEGTEWDKVVNVFSLNAIDYGTTAWAIHRLNGLCTPANAAYSVPELEHQLRDSGAKAIFTCLPLLDTAKKAAKTVGISDERIFLIELPKELTGTDTPKGFKTVDYFVEQGRKEQALETQRWQPGQGAKQVAFLCYSSGTSGLPKGVMISHKNVIANTMQISTFERTFRDKKKKSGSELDHTCIALGLLPLSHIYGLIVVAHVSVYRGDGVVVLPKFEFKQLLTAIQRFRITDMCLVPPIIIVMMKNKKVMDQFDLSSIESIMTGAAPLGPETASELQQMYPHWAIKQGYGLTETCTVVCNTSAEDVVFGTSGCLLPEIKVKLITADGNEVTGYNQPGELVVWSPAVTLGYLNNEKSTKETYIDGWLRTGDEAIITKEKSGNEHITITDRIKELIKVKGHQVAPAELEAHLLTHPAVGDCAVIQVPDADAGEVPKAYVVKASDIGIEENEKMLARKIAKYVEEHKARYKWLKGGVEFIDVIPKSPSGKILRRFLRDKEKADRRKAGAKL